MTDPRIHSVVSDALTSTTQYMIFEVRPEGTLCFKQAVTCAEGESAASALSTYVAEWIGRTRDFAEKMAVGEVKHSARFVALPGVSATVHITTRPTAPEQA